MGIDEEELGPDTGEYIDPHNDESFTGEGAKPMSTVTRSPFPST